MNNLSKPMRDVIEAATDEGLLTAGAARTVMALKTRGLVDDAGLSLTDAGKAVRAELLSENQGDVNPTADDVASMTGDPVSWVGSVVKPQEQYAEWERELLADARVDPNTGVPVADSPVETTNDTPEGEDPREAVPGLEKLLDTPHVVPNRKDRRNRKRIMRAFNRLFARKRDQQTKKLTDARKAARKRGKVSA
jgi:hypothetical protein